jgi:hypothetical protein
MRLLFILVAFSFWMGCSPRTTPFSQTERKDSVAVREYIHDTVIVVYGDSAAAEVKIDTGISVLELLELLDTPIKRMSGNATSSIARQGNKIIAKCKCDSVEVELKKAVRETEYYKFQSEHNKEVIVKREEYVPWLTEKLAWFGGAVLVFGFFFLIVKLNKKF